jgi:hypothetical protein
VDPFTKHRLSFAPGKTNLWIELQLDGPPDDSQKSQMIKAVAEGSRLKAKVLTGELVSVPAMTSVGAAGLEISFESRGPLRILVELSTNSPGSLVEFLWESNLLVFHGPIVDEARTTGAGPLYFHVDDETGPDWAGADEVRVTAMADAFSLPSIHHNDADTGDYLTLGFANTQPVRFVETLDIRVTEEDPDGNAVGGVLLPDDLPAGTGLPVLNGRLAIRVGSGTYALFYNLSRWLRRKNLS